MVLVLLWVCLAVLPGCSGTGQESASVPGNSIPSSLPGGADSSPYQADALDPAVEDGIAEVEVVEVIDGDTIRILLGGRVQKLRLIGVDSPELNHPARGEEPLASSARDFTRTRLAGQTVRLEFDVEQTDQYGRLLGYIWLGDELFNETLLKKDMPGGHFSAQCEVHRALPLGPADRDTKWPWPVEPGEPGEC